MRIAVFKQSCHAIMVGSEKILIISDSKEEDVGNEGTQELDQNDLMKKTQEIARSNQAEKDMVLSFLPPSIPWQEGKSPNNEDELEEGQTMEFKEYHEHIIYQKYIV